MKLDAIARLPLAGDNVAIATQRLEAGTTIAGDQQFVLDYTVLEGHRFAAQPIAAGGGLLSWQLPFGVALQAIGPGTYVGNAGMRYASPAWTSRCLPPPTLKIGLHPTGSMSRASGRAGSAL